MFAIELHESNAPLAILTTISDALQLVLSRLIDHEFEVNGTSAVLTIVLDVFGPRFAFDVN